MMPQPSFLADNKKNGEEEAGHERDELQQRDTILIAKGHLGSRGAGAANMGG